MARPSKSVAVLCEEKRSHRTKAEIQQRENSEADALTGLPLRESSEVANDAVAHAEFMRVKELLSAVKKNDALYESVINDYCTYKSDIARYTIMREDINSGIEEIKDADMDSGLKYKLKLQLYKQIMECDRQIQTFQKKRFDIEKENGMTIASSLRSIPKAPNKKENPLLEALRDDGS